MLWQLAAYAPALFAAVPIAALALMFVGIVLVGKRPPGKGQL